MDNNTVVYYLVIIVSYQKFTRGKVYRFGELSPEMMHFLQIFKCFLFYLCKYTLHLYLSFGWEKFHPLLSCFGYANGNISHHNHGSSSSKYSQWLMICMKKERTKKICWNHILKIHSKQHFKSTQSFTSQKFRFHSSQF